MKRGHYRNERKYSSSDSESSYSDDSSEQPQNLYRDLKSSLESNDRYANKLIYTISKMYRENVGVLRVSIPGSFTFNQTDIQQFFRKYGKIENIIIKQNNLKNANIEDQATNKILKEESIAYIIYSEYFSALLALRVLNSMDEKERIITAKLCLKTSNTEEQLFSEPLIGSFPLQSMIIEVEEDYEFGPMADGFKYRGVIGLDLTDKTFHLKERILGSQGCNFIRVYYMCEKMFRFYHEHEESNPSDLVIKLVINTRTQSERDVLVMSNCLDKYNHAMKLLHELMEQIVEEYKNSREKSLQIIPKDIHVKKWEKFAVESQLRFLNS